MRLDGAARRKEVDLRGELGAVRAPALVLAGEDDAWAPLESAREAVEGLLAGPTRFRSFPRRSPLGLPRRAGGVQELRLFLDDAPVGEAKRHEGRGQRSRPLLRPRRASKLVPDGPWMRERPTVILLHTGSGVDHSLCKEHIGPALAEGRAGRLPRPARGRPQRLELARALDVDTWVDDVGAFCDVLEIERPVCSARRSAARSRCVHAARHPDRVERLVLVSTVARYVHTRSIAESRPARRAGGRRGRGALLLRPAPRPRSPSSCASASRSTPATRSPRTRSLGLEMNMALILDWDRTRPRASTCGRRRRASSCPTLVLAGEDDPSTTISRRRGARGGTARRARPLRAASRNRARRLPRPPRGDRARPRVPATRPSRRRRFARTSGHSSSRTLYQAESRFSPPRTSMCLRWIPSNCAGSAAIAPRERSFSASVFSSTRRQPSRSKASLEHQQLGLDVRARSPGVGREPRPADLEARVLRPQRQEARAPHRATGLLQHRREGELDSGGRVLEAASRYVRKSARVAGCTIESQRQVRSSRDASQSPSSCRRRAARAARARLPEPSPSSQPLDWGACRSTSTHAWSASRTSRSSSGAPSRRSSARSAAQGNVLKQLSTFAVSRWLVAAELRRRRRRWLLRRLLRLLSCVRLGP